MTTIADDAIQLADVMLFKGLSAEQLARIETLLRRRRFVAGSVVVAAEEPGDVAYVVLDGTVKVRVDHTDGTEVILAVLRAGEVVGEMSVVDRLGRSASVIAMEESVLAWMPRAEFWACLRDIPAMTYNLVLVLSRRLRLANTRIEALTALEVDGRVARQLLAFVAEYGEPTPGGGQRIPIPLTQNDLASLVGASRVRVNQVLGVYRRRGCLAVDEQRRITVLDPAALAEDCV